MTRKTRGNAHMFVKDLDSLPESMRDKFTEYEYNGEKGYMDNETISLANAHQANKQKLSERF